MPRVLAVVCFFSIWYSSQHLSLEETKMLQKVSLFKVCHSLHLLGRQIQGENKKCKNRGLRHRFWALEGTSLITHPNLLVIQRTKSRSPRQGLNYPDCQSQDDKSVIWDSVSLQPHRQCQIYRPVFENRNTKPAQVSHQPDSRGRAIGRKEQGQKMSQGEKFFPLN